MLLFNKKRVTERERQATYISWSQRAFEQKHNSNSRCSSMTFGFGSHSVSMSRPSPVRLRVRIPSPSIPNPFMGSPTSLAPLSPIKYAPVLTETAQVVAHVPELNPPHQRAMSMSASSQSDYGDAMSLLSDVDPVLAKRPFRESVVNDDSPSMKSFIQPPNAIPPPPVPRIAYRPASLRKPIPIIHYLPNATPLPFPERPTVSTPAPAALSIVATTDPPVYHPYALATPTAEPLRPMNSPRPREAALQAIIEALDDAHSTGSRRISAASSRRTSSPSGGSKLWLVGRARARSRSVWSALSVSTSGSDTSASAGSMRSGRARNGPFAVDFPLPPDSATSEGFVLTPTRSLTFRSPSARMFRSGSTRDSYV